MSQGLLRQRAAAQLRLRSPVFEPVGQIGTPGGGLLIRSHRAMLFLYHLPNWLMAVCIVGTVVTLDCPGYVLIHRLWPVVHRGGDESIVRHRFSLR
jgi:hypothetical protein